MSDGRTHYADDETIAYIAKLEAERDEALQREAKNADKLEHYRMYFIPKLTAFIPKLTAELAEWKLRALTVESLEEDARQAAVKFKTERDRLRDAIKRHRLDVWGDHEVGHPADCELYAGLQEAKQ